jgi:predicted RNase H-like HicB family nuclease
MGIHLHENNGFTITFPNPPDCLTECADLDEALLMAAEAMAWHLYGTIC